MYTINRIIDEHMFGRFVYFTSSKHSPRIVDLQPSYFKFPVEYIYPSNVEKIENILNLWELDRHRLVGEE